MTSVAMFLAARQLNKGMTGFMFKGGAGKDLLQNLGSNSPSVTFIQVGEPRGAGKKKSE